MEKILVKADRRPELGKGGARSLRRDGLLPAVVYSGGSSTPIKVFGKEMTKLIRSGVGEHALITIELNEDGKSSEHPVLIKDYQADPVSDDILHIDFMEVSLKERIHVTVPIEITKIPAGVKMGGILQHLIREVEVECLPTEIPDKVGVDAEFIQIGNSLHVSDIPEQENVKIITAPEEVILTVSAPVVEEVKEEIEEAEEAEPEVITSKAKEEEPEKEEK